MIVFIGGRNITHDSLPKANWYAYVAHFSNFMTGHCYICLFELAYYNQEEPRGCIRGHLEVSPNYVFNQVKYVSSHDQPVAVCSRPNKEDACA